MSVRLLSSRLTACNWPASGPAPNAEVGVELPSSVELRPVPQEVVGRVPQTNGYYYTVTGNKVLLVSPPTRIVVAEISG